VLEESSVFNKELRMETRVGRRHLELAELDITPHFAKGQGPGFTQ
jgi:hypothetical protein